MRGDEVIVAALVLAFAVLVTAHVTLVVGLATRQPWWRAPVALFVAPLAPYWGYQAGLRRRAITWAAAAVGYAVFRWIANL